MDKGTVFFLKCDSFLLLLHKIITQNAEIHIYRQWK